MWSTPRVRDVVVVDEDLWDGELRNSSHTTLFLEIHGTAESARPVQCIEEANNDIAAHSFFDALESRATS